MVPIPGFTAVIGVATKQPNLFSLAFMVYTSPTNAWCTRKLLLAILTNNLFKSDNIISLINFSCYPGDHSSIHRNIHPIQGKDLSCTVCHWHSSCHICVCDIQGNLLSWP